MKKKIGIFANAWSGEFLKYTVSGIQKAAKRDGADIFMFTTFILASDNTKNNMSQLNLFHLPSPENLDGIIMLSNSFNIPDEAERVKKLFVEKGVPALSLEVKLDGVAFMGTSNRKGMYDAVEHLITEHGCKRIIYCAGIADNQENIIRKQATVDALKAHGLELMDEIPGDYGNYTTSVRLRSYLEAGKELPDAFVCANDHMALGVSTTLFSMGYSVPEDTRVTGFDFISDSQVTFPMLATVNRAWDKLGEKAYYKLLELIEKPDPEFEQYFDPVFIPSESCGCKANDESAKYRLSAIRGAYAKRSETTIMDMYFSDLRTTSTTVFQESDFNEKIGPLLQITRYPLGDYYMCIEPDFFTIDDDDYPERIRGYSNQMHMIFGRENGKRIPEQLFEKNKLLPTYDPDDGESNLYLFVPLSYMKYIIGYVVIKNDTGMLFERTLRIWLMNMNTFFINLKRYISAQQANKKLKEIYMNDFLTGMYNRYGCEKMLYPFIEERKNKGSASVLMFADIDKMKEINDNYGHLNGDIAIKATADAMKDTLGEKKWLFGRYGGDEFIAVGSADELAEETDELQFRLLKGMESYIKKLNLNFSLSVSVGLCVISPDDERTIEEYIKNADVLMYKQKQVAHKRKHWDS